MAKNRLLIVEDEEAIRSQMRWAFEDDFEVLLAEDRNSALERVRTKRPPLILLDLGLPPSPRRGEEGLMVLEEILIFDREAKVIVVTGNQDQGNALKAIGQGAFDYFLKPVDIDELTIVLKRALHIRTLEKGYAAERERSISPVFDKIIGNSSSMRLVFNTIRKVSASDVSVLIQGESGTGKELIARAIHHSGNRKDASFVPINCGAIPENLLESELFGYEKGAFTGADTQKRGRIEYAAGGTLFLDEIGELSLPLQVKLLRFLQEPLIERVGGRETIPVDVRIVAATNKDLKQEIERGRFREDLYYRLGVVTITVPPLRERTEDAILLAKVFLQEFSEKYKKNIKGFRADALDAVSSYDWPGNVRELENRVKRAIVMCEGKSVTPEDLGLPSSRTVAEMEPLKEIRRRVEREHIRNALVNRNWNISQVAEELGVSRPTLHDLIKKYRIEREE